MCTLLEVNLIKDATSDLQANQGPSRSDTIDLRVSRLTPIYKIASCLYQSIQTQDSHLASSTHRKCEDSGTSHLSIHDPMH